MRASFLRRQPDHHEAACPHPAARPRFALLICLAACLGGCTSSLQWVKDGFSAQHAEAQYASCQLEAERLRYFSSESDEEREARIHHEAGLCMRAEGWQQVEGSGSPTSGSAGEEPARQSRARAVSLGSGRGLDPGKDSAGNKSSPEDPEDGADDPASGKKEGGGDGED